jgi:predicted dehydrogenase
LQGNYGEYYNGVYKAITENTEMPVTGEEGMNVIKIIEAATLSNKEKRVIEL